MNGGHSLRRTVVITNPQGFHMRPKAAFAQTASRFQGDVSLHWEGATFNGKSIFELMLLAAPEGSEVEVEVNGPDAAEALEALSAVLAAPGEDSCDSALSQQT
jgi:phosphotransferase system HPr (HPr) family protein